MNIKAYIGLFGSHGSGPWREQSTKFFQERGIAAEDPTNPAWNQINDTNGDAQQATIDDLVFQQHELIRGAACILYHLCAFDLEGHPLTAFAARCELGFLTGSGKRTFVHIDPQTVGRNYLWAQIKPYPHMTRCNTLEDAWNQTAAWFQEEVKT